MRTLAFVLAAIVGLAMITPAQGSQTVKLGLGEQKTVNPGRVSVKFLELIEDSRCPADVNCVWAGVAKIKVRVSRGGRSTDVELNTMDKKSTVFQGYTVTLTDLEPRQSTTSKYSQTAYSATITVSKAKR